MKNRHIIGLAIVGAIIALSTAWLAGCDGPEDVEEVSLAQSLDTHLDLDSGINYFTVVALDAGRMEVLIEQSDLFETNVDCSTEYMNSDLRFDGNTEIAGTTFSRYIPKVEGLVPTKNGFPVGDYCLTFIAISGNARPHVIARYIE